MKKKTRQPNFEILRSLSMMMIVVWHFNQNVLMKSHTRLSYSFVEILNILITHYIVTLCSVCVNVYVLITGYFLSTKKFTLHRVIRVWVHTFFYSVVISVIFCFLKTGSLFSFDVLKSCFPLRFGEYWFIKDFIGLLFLSPFLSIVISKMTKLQYTSLLLLLIFVIATNYIFGFPLGDILGFQMGYSLAWFVSLFLFGGYINRFAVCETPGKMLKFYLLGGVTLAFFDVGRMFLKGHFNISSLVYADLHYNSFPIFLSIALFLYFKNHCFMDNYINRLLVMVAPYTFGVYLIHSNKYISPLLWSLIAKNMDIVEVEGQILYMILVSIGIFLACILVDAIRSRLFSILRVDSFVSAVSLWCDNNLKVVLYKLAKII